MNYNKNLHRIRSPHRRLFLSHYLSCLILIGNLQPQRARVHWVGGRRKSHLFERLVIAIIFPCAVLRLSSREVIIWSTVIVGVASIFLTADSIYRTIPRKGAHTV